MHKGLKKIQHIIVFVICHSKKISKLFKTTSFQWLFRFYKYCAALKYLGF